MSTARTLATVDTVFIHCSATPNGKRFTAEDINRWHKERGFKRDRALYRHHAENLQYIGYHYVIRVDGCVEVGRKLVEIGAHVQSHNARSIGTCLIGTDKFSADQWLMLRKQIEALRAQIPSIKFIRGHNEVAAKTCPGFSVPEWLAGGMQPLAAHLLAEE